MAMTGLSPGPPSARAILSWPLPDLRLLDRALVRGVSLVSRRCVCSIAGLEHIAPGRDGLFNLIRSLPGTLKYENQLIVAEGDYVIAHGRFSGHGRPAAWIAADIVRIKDGQLAEHWDVLQDEATKSQSVSGLPMFGERFPE